MQGEWAEEEAELYLGGEAEGSEGEVKQRQLVDEEVGREAQQTSTHGQQ